MSVMLLAARALGFLAVVSFAFVVVPSSPINCC